MKNKKHVPAGSPGHPAPQGSDAQEPAVPADLIDIADQDGQQYQSGEKSFRKGNINFDVLEPENPVTFSANEFYKAGEAASGNADLKRGIFDMGRKRNPVKFYQVISWSVVFVSSLILLGVILFLAKSVFWILALPVVLISFIWSFIMLALFKARPR